MYDGVGLKTVRGSGTSGYIQKNLSYIAPGQKTKTLQNHQNYGQVLKHLKENPAPLPRPPNRDILKHEMLRKIEGHLFSMKKDLTKAGELSSEEVDDKIVEERKRLHKMAEDNPDQDILQLIKGGDKPRQDGHSAVATSSQKWQRRDEGHTARLNQQQHMSRVKDALKISDSHKFGEAFDFDLQDRKREEAEQERKAREEAARKQRKKEKRERQMEEYRNQINQIKRDQEGTTAPLEEGELTQDGKGDKKQSPSRSCSHSEASARKRQNSEESGPRRRHRSPSSEVKDSRHRRRRSSSSEEHRHRSHRRDDRRRRRRDSSSSDDSSRDLRQERYRRHKRRYSRSYSSESDGRRRDHHRR